MKKELTAAELDKAVVETISRQLLRKVMKQETIKNFVRTLTFMNFNAANCPPKDIGKPIRFGYWFGAQNNFGQLMNLDVQVYITPHLAKEEGPSHEDVEKETPR